jgi:hypothetical protein
VPAVDPPGALLAISLALLAEALLVDIRSLGAVADACCATGARGRRGRPLARRASSTVLRNTRAYRTGAGAGTTAIARGAAVRSNPARRVLPSSPTQPRHLSTDAA